MSVLLEAVDRDHFHPVGKIMCRLKQGCNYQYNLENIDYVISPGREGEEVF